jgi:arylsulfatase A-like enzyme
MISGAYFVLTSIYCLLAFLPYTFFFLIKAPPYAWMPWFVRHQAVLYCVAAGAAMAANWRLPEAWNCARRRFAVGGIFLAGAGVYLTFHPFLATLGDNSKAYSWSLAALLFLIALVLWAPVDKSAADESEPDNTGADKGILGYSAGAISAVVVCIVYATGSRLHLYSETRTISFHWADVELTLWSLLSHLLVAVVVVSILNLIFLLADRTPRPPWFRRAGVNTLVFVSLWITLARFLDNALSFAGWQARVYSGALALTLTLWGFSIVRPFLDAAGARASQSPSDGRFSHRMIAWVVLAASIMLAVAFPYLVHGADWSGLLEGTVALSVWIAVFISLARLRPVRARYSAFVVLLVLAGCGVVYKTFQATEILWSKPLGATDDEISLALQAYGEQDISFQLAHHIVGDRRGEVCGDLCHILREYTNIRNAEARVDIQLVDKLTPSPNARPNIFIFVIDSMRPDYLGAYNPRVNFTPNLDDFARDSVVLHHAYTQYAGTSLSEPAIWSGAMMLHAHYPQPFSRLNSLDRMVHSDGYRTLASVDEVLTYLLPADDDITNLDPGMKLWNELEVGATLQQARSVLNARRNDQPVFLYTQPKNVHQFARNRVPSPTSQHWQAPDGMNIRISYEVHWVDKCLGEFFDYLKQRGMYDNSIIIVTSDHGDATGEFGRLSHSTLIWPEVMHVPLLIHLPPKMRERLVYDDTRISTLTDIAPTLYYLLGHRPILQSPLYGRPLFAETKAELERYPHKDLLLASDVRAVYGILSADERYLYTTYDSPAQSYLFDLIADPNALHSILTPALKQRYDQEIIEHLQLVGDFYGYKPGMASLLASAQH